MSVLSKNTIEELILPHLSWGKSGKMSDPAHVFCIVQLIFHRLKTGCQWRELPIGHFIDQSYSWQSVFYHFNKWSKDGSWLSVWTCLPKAHKDKLNLSTAQLDGTHTPSKRGGQAVDYQVRKGCKTSNILCISDEQGIIVAASQPESGNHHDVFDIETHFEELLNMLELIGIETKGLVLNADAAFDTENLRALCAKHGIDPNFDLNPRNGSRWDRDEYFDPIAYKKRTVIERAFAWLDAFKALLVRYEITARNWFAWNLIGFTAIFARKKIR